MDDNIVDQIVEQVWENMAPVLIVQLLSLSTIAGHLADEMNTSTDYLLTLSRRDANDIMKRYEQLNEISGVCAKQAESIEKELARRDDTGTSE